MNDLDKVAELLLQGKQTLITAESCTGGLLGQLITDIPGASSWYEGGFITYSNEAKSQMLSVPMELIADKGAVSIEVAESLALNALQESQASWSLSVTGVAGPGGGTKDKPVGTVCFAWANKHATKEIVVSEIQSFSGDRESIRNQSAEYAFKTLRALLEKVSE